MNTQKVLTLLNEMGDIDYISEIGDCKMIYAWRQLHEYATECLHFEIANKKGGRIEEVYQDGGHRSGACLGNREFWRKCGNFESSNYAHKRFPNHYSF